MNSAFRTREFFNFIQERHRIYVRRFEQKLPGPWTKDPILQKYRFCNVYRELDTVTEWIAENWRRPHCDEPHLWFAMTVARLVNWPGTLQELTSVIFGDCVTWYPKQFVAVLRNRMQRGKQVFTGAYLVNQRILGGTGMDKASYLAEYVLTPMWQKRCSITSGNFFRSLADAHASLATCEGIGSFMAAQIIADLKYVEPLKSAPDWWTWAASGPGSKRGMNRLLGEPTDTPWKEREWQAAMSQLIGLLSPLVDRAGMPRMHAQDIQNCLCEWEKYERTRLGEGRPRQNFKGA